MTQTTTHAGGVVFRCKSDAVEYLLVTASNMRDEWVLPKGHIEAGEDREAAALREVREEAGVTARVLGLVAENIRFTAQGKDVDATFFLMEYLGDVAPPEDRLRCWVPFDDALNCLRYREARDVLTRAERQRAMLHG